MTDVAVVVATHNRRDLLRRLLDALAATEFDRDAIEVIVVDDGSTDGTWERLGSLQQSCGLSMRALKLDNRRGPAAARNAGWRATTARLVAFTDDDCEPQPGWLPALIRATVAGADFVQGKTLPDPTRPLGPFSHTMRVTEPSGRYETCNMLYRRSLLESLDGFDETFRHPYGEDTDLGIRAADSGAAFAFADDAVVHHDVSPSSFVARAKAAPRLEGVVLAVARHPRLRDQMTAGVWTKPHHPHAAAAAVGVLWLVAGGLSRKPVIAGLALQLPFLWYRTFVDQLPARKWKWPLVLPLALFIDAVNLAALLRASVKHRTLVL